MIHKLWQTGKWKEASEEEVIMALFDTPQHIPPEDVWAIRTYHPEAKTKYLNLFYEGRIPKSVKEINGLNR